MPLSEIINYLDSCESLPDTVTFDLLQTLFKTKGFTSTDLSFQTGPFTYTVHEMNEEGKLMHAWLERHFPNEMRD